MTTHKLFFMTFFFVLAAAGAAMMSRYTDRSTVSSEPPSSAAFVAVASPDCVPALFEGQPLVNGLGEVEVAAFPGARRLSYGEAGSSQYVVKATPAEVLGFYDDRMQAGCWQRTAQGHNEVEYVKNDTAVRLALLENPVSGKTIIHYYGAESGEVRGESVFMAQTSCPEGQVSCTSSMGGNWCQMPPCPTETPPPSSTPPPSTTSCSSSYQQSGSTSPSCNYSTCPSGCTWDSQGCPNGCMNSSSGTTPPPSSTSTCPSGQYWCGSTNSCKPTSDTNCAPSGGSSSGYYPDKTSCEAASGRWCQPTVSPHCHGPNDSTPCEADVPGGGGSGCPSGQYWCNGACVSTSTSCSNTSTSCPSDKYWCNGSCIAMGSYCAPSGSGDKTSCESAGGLWCQPTTSPHCHYGPNPSSCEADTSYSSSCPSGQYWCNGSCVANTASCNSATWPSDPASCTGTGKYWCTPSYGGYGWCQSTACTNTGTSSSCASGTYFCPSSNSCVSNSSTCGSYTTPACPSGQYWCGSTNSCKPTSDTYCPPSGGGSGCPSGQYWCSTTSSCMSSTSSCPSPLPIPAPQPIVKCGQCQVAQGNSCVSAPVGTPDPLCNGGQCDMYGGCVQLSGGRKLVGRGAICGDNWCNADKGENKENCPSDGCTNAPAQPPQPNTLTQPLVYPPYPQEQRQGQPVYPQGPFGPQDQYGPQGPQYQGPSEEEMERMRKEQFDMMKKGMRQFVRGVTQMQRFVSRLETRLKRQGIGIPPELKNALATAPVLVKKFEAAKSFEEVEPLMDDMQDIGMAMQEWGPRLGELEQLAQMLQGANRDIRTMYSTFKRLQDTAKRRPELAEQVREMEGIVGTLTRIVNEAKELAKTDPEAAMDKVQEFYSYSEEYWNLVSLVEMVTNLQRGLSEAQRELTLADRRVRTLEKSGTVDLQVITDLKAILVEIRAMLPKLKSIVNTKPVDFEQVRDAAESFWQMIEEFEDLMAAQGQSTYIPNVRKGQSLEVDIPDGFIMPQPGEGPQFGEGGFVGGSPSGFGSSAGGGGGFPGSIGAPQP